MNAIQLIAVVNGSGNSPVQRSDADLELLDHLAGALACIFQVSCHVRQECMGANFAFDPARGQYFSTAILQQMESLGRGAEMHILGVTSLDLFIPILTYVFGEAQLEGGCAIVSYHRLQEEFYGLPPNRGLLRERLCKEATHELGHTLGLRHCPDWRCVMASSHDVERLDLKGEEYCRDCLAKASLEGPAPRVLRIPSGFEPSPR